MKTSKFLFAAAFAASLVGCQDDTFVSNDANNNAGLKGKLVKSGLLGIGRSADNASTRAYSVDGQFIWMPTGLTEDGKITTDLITGVARSNQRIGFCWTGMNNQEPEYSAATALSQKVYTNYEFEHVGWLDEDATGVERDECAPFALLNGGYIVGETKNNDVADWQTSAYTSEKGNGTGTKYQTGVSAKSYPIGTYQNNKGTLNLGSGLFKTENSDVFEGEYLVYFPYNDGFTKGQIIAAQPDHFDINVAENRFTTLSRYAFSIGRVGHYAGGQSLEKINTRTLSSFAGVKLYDSSVNGGETKIKKVIFYANENGFVFKKDLDAKKCIEALKTGARLDESVYYNGEGENPTATKAADVNAIYATLSNGTDEYATVISKNEVKVYFPVLPQTIKGLTVVLINEKDKSYVYNAGDVKFESGKDNSIAIDLNGAEFQNKYMVVDEETLFSAMENIKDAKGTDEEYTIQLLRDVRIENVMSHSTYVGSYGTMFFNKNIEIMTECKPEVGISLASGQEMYIKSENSDKALTFNVPFTVEGAGCCEENVARLSVGGKQEIKSNVNFAKIINHGALALANVAKKDANDKEAYIKVGELVNEYDEWAIDKEKTTDAAQLFLLGGTGSHINIETLTNKGTVTASAVTVGKPEMLTCGHKTWTECVAAAITTLNENSYGKRTVNVTVGELTNEVSTGVKATTTKAGGVIDINGFAELKVETLTNVSEDAVIRTLNVVKGKATSTLDGRLVLTGASTNNGIIDNSGVTNLEGQPMQNKGLLIDQLSGQLGGQYIINGEGEGVERTYNDSIYKTDLKVEGMYVSKAATQQRLNFTLTDEVASASVNVIEIVGMDVKRFNLVDVDPNGTLENKDVYIAAGKKKIVFKAFEETTDGLKAAEKYFGHCVTIREGSSLEVTDGLLKTKNDLNVEATAQFILKEVSSTVDKAEIAIGRDLNNFGETTNKADILTVTRDLNNKADATFISDSKFVVKQDVNTAGTFDSNGTPNEVGRNFAQTNGSTTFAFKTTTSIKGQFSCVAPAEFLREALGTSGDYRATVNVGGLGTLTGDNQGGGWPTVRRE